MRKNRILTSKMQFIWIISIFVIPFISFILIYNLYTLNIFKVELAKANHDTVFLYQQNLEMDMKRIEYTMSEYWATDIQHQQLVFPLDEITAHVNTLEIMEKYKSMLKTYEMIGVMFIASEKNDIYRSVYNDSYDTSLRHEIQEHVTALIADSDKINLKDWSIFSFENKNFLVRIFGRNGAYNLCLIDLDRTARPQDAVEPANSMDPAEDPEGGFLVYATISGHALTETDTLEKEYIELQPDANEFYITGQATKYFVVQSQLCYGDIMLIYLSPYFGSLYYKDTVQLFFLILSIMVLLLIPVSYMILVKSYFKPFEALLNTMKKIKGGDWDAKIEKNYHIFEFQQMSTTFNKMIDEIKYLKIKSYEQKIQKQQADLQYLQLQIKPHFFLNCLKILYGMVEQGKSGEVQEMILSVSDYIRYIFHDNMRSVTLERELQHVKNYILLQKQSIEKTITMEVQIDEAIKEHPIPMLAVQTFIENSFKYAMRPGEDLVLSIRAIYLNSPDGGYIDITIQDNGPGFSEEYIKHFRQCNAFSYQGDHVGILNIKQRLQILYHGKAALTCMNNDIGALCEIIIPINNALEETGG